MLVKLYKTWADLSIEIERICGKPGFSGDCTKIISIFRHFELTSRGKTALSTLTSKKFLLL
jgi:hypothetical protein